LAPADPNLLATRAYLLAAHREVAQALNDANAAVRHDSGNADALWIRAGILMELRQFEAAENDLSHALLVEPEVLRARQWRAMVRFRTNRHAEAIEDANIVLAQRRFDPTMLQLRAGSHMALGQHEAAIDDLNRLLGEPGTPSTAAPAMPMFRQLYLQRAVLSAHIGRRQDALSDLDAILAFGGRQTLLALQVHLRKHGFPDVPIDGKRTPALEGATMACLVNQACGRGLAVGH
jgi:tetratricopeptide (TPR) repeat protein